MIDAPSTIRHSAGELGKLVSQLSWGWELYGASPVGIVVAQCPSYDEWNVT